jgi:hypothetical protein
MNDDLKAIKRAEKRVFLADEARIKAQLKAEEKCRQAEINLRRVKAAFAGKLPNGEKPVLEMTVETTVSHIADIGLFTGDFSLPNGTSTSVRFNLPKQELNRYKKGDRIKLTCRFAPSQYSSKRTWHIDEINPVIPERSEIHDQVGYDS